MSEDMEDEAPKSVIKLKRLKVPGNRPVVRVQLDGPADNFASASVISATGDLVPQDNEEDALSSDDEIFKDVRAFVRQTIGKPALVKVESGICGIRPPEDASMLEHSRPQTPWHDVGSNYITVRHAPPDAPIDVPPLPGCENGSVQKIVACTGLCYELPLACRHWFNPRWVSDLERAELSTFGISEDTYRDLRDKLIDAYNIDPSKFLSVRNAREATGYGEVGVLTKVWGFLDYWGIINFLSDPSTAPRYSKKLIDFPIGRPQEPLEKVLCCSCRQECVYTAYALKPEAAPLIPKDQIVPARFCAACINTGNYPPFFSKAAFEAVDVVVPGTVTAEFSEEDSMRLIEAIQRYGTDWESVARMIGGGKSAAQCLLQFIQIPISEKAVPAAHSESTFRPKVNPFRNESSKLLTYLSVLASSVPAEVATQAASLT
jgi:hypothetical protein